MDLVETIARGLEAADGKFHATYYNYLARAALSAISEAVSPMFDRVEHYGFECEAGPLRNCVDWKELKELLTPSQSSEDRE